MHGATCPTCHGAGAIEMPLPLGWVEARSALNAVYYIHSATREVVLDSAALPAAHARITNFLAELGLASLAQQQQPNADVVPDEQHQRDWQPLYASRALEAQLRI